MKPVLANLLAQLGLERIEQNIFRGQSQDLGWGAIFGGQVVGQALSAAVQTVGPDRHVHSLHGYFLRQGDAKRPVVYEVDPIRDGKSFTTRRVVAVQGGHAIFSLEASFQLEEPGLDHQEESPETVPPDDLQSDQQRWAEVAANRNRLELITLCGRASRASRTTNSLLCEFNTTRTVGAVVGLEVGAMTTRTATGIFHSDSNN